MSRRLLAGLLLFASLSSTAATPPPAPPSPPAPLPKALVAASALRETGRLVEASVLLEEALASAEGGEREALAFALAEALRLQGDPEAAALHLAPVAASKGSLSPYAAFALARCLAESGKAEEALSALSPCLGPKVPAALREAALRLSTIWALRYHDPAGAVRASEALEKLHPKQRAERRFCRAEALLAAQRLPEAQRLLATLWREEPDSPWGRRAGLLLRRLFPEAKLPIPPDAGQALLLARTFLSGGRTADAWEVLQSLREKKLPPPAQEGADQLRAAVLYALRWNAELHAYADALRARNPAGATAQFADLKALWACLRADDAARAELLAGRLLASPGAKPATVSEVRFALGTLYYCRGEWQKALENLDAMSLDDAGDTARVAAPYRAAWVAKKLGDAPGALARMHKVAASAPPNYADPARYFAALWQEEAGQPYLAHAGWESLALGPGYWASAAREALAARGKTLPPRAPKAALPSPYAPRDEEGHLAELLALAGFPDFAAELFEGVCERNRKDPSARFRFAQLLAAGDQVGRAAAMARADFGDPERLDALPADLIALFYPNPFRTQMPAVKPPLTPALACAITKRESGFDPQILSPAGAVGLMQLMPDTATKLALPGESLPAEEELVDPATNLRLGTTYLAQLWGLLGKEEAVIAAYNAGEERVGLWMRAFQATDEREFIAMIPYEETRLYTQRVLFDRRRYSTLAQQ